MIGLKLYNIPSIYIIWQHFTLNKQLLFLISYVLWVVITMSNEHEYNNTIIVSYIYIWIENCLFRSCLTTVVVIIQQTGSMSNEIFFNFTYYYTYNIITTIWLPLSKICRIYTPFHIVWERVYVHTLLIQ